MDIFNQIGNQIEEDKRRKSVVEGGVEEYEKRDDSDSDVTLT